MERGLYQNISTKDNLNDEQINILLNEFVELHPYLEKCYLLHVFEPETKLVNIYIVFEFDANKHLDLSNISDATKNKWNLDNLQDMFDKKKEEAWRHSTFAYVGIPPIKRLLPVDLKQKLNLI
jgi:hypothetical protein